MNMNIAVGQIYIAVGQIYITVGWLYIVVGQIYIVVGQIYDVIAHKYEYDNKYLINMNMIININLNININPIVLLIQTLSPTYPFYYKHTNTYVTAVTNGAIKVALNGTTHNRTLVNSVPDQ